MGIQSVAAKTSADAANKNALAAEQAAHAARDGAAAAVQGIDVTVKQFHSAQRAWIFISNYTMSGEPEGDGFVLITCHVINSGKTPAVLTVNQNAIGFMAVGAPSPQAGFGTVEEIPEPDWSKINPGPLISIPPGLTEFKFNLHLRFSKAYADSYRRKERKAFVFSLVSYRDVFGHPHWTKACAKHTFGESLDSFEFCSHGNDTDKQYFEK